MAEIGTADEAIEWMERQAATTRNATFKTAMKARVAALKAMRHRDRINSEDGPPADLYADAQGKPVELLRAVNAPASSFRNPDDQDT